MTEVSFYILEHPAGDRLRFACRIAEKAFNEERRVYIHCADAHQARQMDELLWTFKEDSFVPHGLADDEAGIDEETPVHIGHGNEPAGHDDVLINLAADVPLFFSRFQRVAEIIGGDEQVRQQGRERYRFYRERGYPLNTHNIAANHS